MPWLSDETNGSVLTIESNRCSANQYFHKGTVLELFCKQPSLNFNTCTLRMAVWQKLVQMGLGSCAMQRASNWIWKASSSLGCCLEKKVWVHLPMPIYFLSVCISLYVHIGKWGFFLKNAWKVLYVSVDRQTNNIKLYICNFLKLFSFPFNGFLSLSDELMNRCLMKTGSKSIWKSPVILWSHWIGVLRVGPSGVIPTVCSLQRYLRAPWGPHQLSVFWWFIMRMAKERCHFRGKCSGGQASSTQQTHVHPRDLLLASSLSEGSRSCRSPGTGTAAASLEQDGWPRDGLKRDFWAHDGGVVVGTGTQALPETSGPWPCITICSWKPERCNKVIFSEHKAVSLGIFLIFSLRIYPVLTVNRAVHNSLRKFQQHFILPPLSYLYRTENPQTMLQKDHVTCKSLQGGNSPAACWVKQSKAPWEVLLAVPAASGVLHGGTSAVIRAVSSCWTTRCFCTTCWTGPPGRSRQSCPSSFYTSALMAPGYLAALFCKDLCDYLSSAP